MNATPEFFCPRCGALLFRHRVRVVERTLATASAAALLWIAALTLPFLELQWSGRTQSATLFDCVRQLAARGTPSMAALVAATGIVLPGLLIFALLYLTLGLQLRRTWPGRRVTARFIARVQTWAMAEVYLLGVLVSLLKLAKEAQVGFGSG